MEIVRAFAGQGSNVGFLDFDVEHGETLAAELQAGGGHVRFEACDLRDIDALRRAVAALAEAHGPAWGRGPMLGRRLGLGPARVSPLKGPLGPRPG